jgi:Ca-activated chloride channel family protein
MPNTVTTPPATSGFRLPAFFLTLLLAILGTGFATPVRAQQPVPPPPPGATPPQKPAGKGDEGFRIRRDVDLVVLHATVLDDNGNFVPDLKESNFHVFEDRVEQKIALFKREDVPVTMGLVIDNSASMRTKRPRVNAAALTFVQTSNPQDQVFVVNFNDEYYLDLDKDFTSDVKELREALERIDSRGSTALYDAMVGSLDHLQKGSHDKKVLLVITDGEDNSSRKDLAFTVQAAQQSGAIVYTIGLFSEDDRKEKKRATRALKTVAEATGGEAYFPKDTNEVEAICTKIAHDIRNQYTLAYYPTNSKRDGTFRSVQVRVDPPRGRGKMSIRTRPGYYAHRDSSAAQ